MIGAHLFLVAYDIAAPSRWQRVVRLLSKVGRRSQLSVFLCRCTPARMLRMERDIKSALDEKEDRLLILDLGNAGSAATRIRSANAMDWIVHIETLIV